MMKHTEAVSADARMLTPAQVWTDALLLSHHPLREQQKYKHARCKNAYHAKMRVVKKFLILQNTLIQNKWSYHMV
jgi:hypothetical protein